MDQGWYWLQEKKGHWLTFMTEEDYKALEQFGFDRGHVVQPPTMNDGRTTRSALRCKYW